MPQKDYLLTDADMQRFITHGYHTIVLDDIPDTHKKVCRQTEKTFKDGNPQNEIWKKAPALREVFSHPRVRGALTSLLGHRYVMYSHRHCHFNEPGFPGGKYHQDGTPRKFSGWHRPWRRHFRARTVMAIYYPHDVSLEMGPTGIVPGSQYYSALSDEALSLAMPLSGQAGTITFVHFDIWHRGMPNQSDRNRIMMKFLFKRTAEPEHPTWDAADIWIPDFSGVEHLPDLSLVWEDMWHWHRGAGWPIDEYQDVASDDISTAMEALDSPLQAEAINAAYTLGRMGTPAIPALMDVLDDSPEPFADRIALALSASGDTVIDSLAHALMHPDEWVRATAADTIGDIGLRAIEALDAIRESVHDHDPWVRHNAVETISIWGIAAREAHEDVIEALYDAEAFVRFNAVTALLNMALSDSSLIPSLTDCLLDDHEMVRHHAREVVQILDAA